MVTRSPGARRQGVLMTPAKYEVDRSTGGEVMGIFLQTAQLAVVTLTFDPLTLKLVHGVLVSQGPFLPSLVFVGLFVLPLGEFTGQTDRRIGSIHDGASFYEGRPHNKRHLQALRTTLYACKSRPLDAFRKSLFATGKCRRNKKKNG